MMREPKSSSVNIDTAKYAHIMILTCLCLRNPRSRQSNRIDPLYVTRQLSSKSTVKHPTVTWSNGHVMQVIRHGWGCGISSPYTWECFSTEKCTSTVFAVEQMCPLGKRGAKIHTQLNGHISSTAKTAGVHFLDKTDSLGAVPMC